MTVEFSGILILNRLLNEQLEKTKKEASDLRLQNARLVSQVLVDYLFMPFKSCDAWKRSIGCRFAILQLGA
jgi:hypothetical protein